MFANIVLENPFFGGEIWNRHAYTQLMRVTTLGASVLDGSLSYCYFLYRIFMTSKFPLPNLLQSTFPKSNIYSHLRLSRYSWDCTKCLNLGDIWLTRKSKKIQHSCCNCWHMFTLKHGLVAPPRQQLQMPGDEKCQTLSSIVAIVGLCSNGMQWWISNLAKNWWERDGRYEPLSTQWQF